MGFERDLVLNLTVNKKSNDLGKLTAEGSKAAKTLGDVKKASKDAGDQLDKLENSGNKLSKGLKEVAGSLFIFGSASQGIERLVLNFIKLQSVLNGIRASKDVLDALKGIHGGLTSGGMGDKLLNLSRMTGVAPSKLVSYGNTAKGLVGKWGAPTAVAGGAALAGAAIWKGVNNASHAFEAAGGAANLGHVDMMHDAQGYAYGPQRAYNRMKLQGTGNRTVDALYNMFAPGEAIGIGGGRMNERGDIISNDELLARAGRRRKADYERQAREVQYREEDRGYESQRADIARNQAASSSGIPYADQGRHYRDVVSNRMTQGGADYGNLLEGQEDRFKLLYGQDAGPEKLRAMQASLREQSRGVGTSIGEATAAEKAHADEVKAQRDRVAAAQGIQVGQVGGKENQGEALAKEKTIQAETQKLLDMEAKQVELVKARQTARQQELSVMKEQAHSVEQMARADAASARAAMRGMKQDIGGMAPGDAKLTMGLIRRAKEKGLGSLTPEARNRIAGFLPQETEKFREQQADKLGFNDLMQGTSGQRRVDEADALADKAGKQKIALEQTIDFTAKMDAKETGDYILNRLGPLYKSLEAVVTDIQKRVRALEEGGADAATAFTGATGKTGK